MEQFSAIVQELDQKLLQIESSSSTRLNKCSQKIKLCEDLIIRLKSEYQNTDLNREDQIKFFKAIKPRFTSELHYQMAIFNYYKKLPKGSVKAKKNYINRCMDKAACYQKEHAELQVYMNMGGPSTWMTSIFGKWIMMSQSIQHWSIP